jgi:hypothetical protein
VGFEIKVVGLRGWYCGGKGIDQATEKIVRSSRTVCSL